jgi:hypothetical protein
MIAVGWMRRRAAVPVALTSAKLMILMRRAD